MQRQRDELYPFFEKHAIPTASNFVDLIDSMLNQETDGVFKPSGDPLSIKGIGAEEGLLNFYRVDEQSANQLTWQFKQKPTSATNAGLSIHDAAADPSNAPSRLFIEGGTGYVGLGTMTPKSALAVSGGVAVGTTYATTNAAGGNNLIVEGNVGIGTTAPGAKLSFVNRNATEEAVGLTWHDGGPTHYGIHRTAGPWSQPDFQQLRLGWLTGIILDGGTGFNKSYVDIQGNGLRVTAGNVGIGTTAPKSALAVSGGVAVGTTYAETNAAGDNNLIVQGNVGIGTTAPGAKLDVGGVKDTSGQISLQLRSGNTSGNFESNQITLGYNNAIYLRHAIKTRHNSTNQLGNAIDFYVWKYLSNEDKDNLEDIGSLHTMTLAGGNVGIGTTEPGEKLEVNGKIRCNNERKMVSATNTITTTSTAWMDMANMILFITTAANPVLLLFKAGGVGIWGGTNVRADFRMVLDGGVVATTSHEFNNDGWEIRDASLCWLAQLSKGTHTVKIQWKVSSSGKSLKVCHLNGTRSLMAIEL